MSLFHQRSIKFLDAPQLIPRRSGAAAAFVNPETAMRNSAVWACLTLRADLISSFPVDAFRRVDGVQVEVPKPPVLVTPGGPRVRMREWMYSSQMDLDRSGNAIGRVRERDGAGRPARIDLWPADAVTVIVKDGDLSGYRYRGTVYDPLDVWHEKQYTVPGLHVGLSPVAHAALVLGEYASVQQFALDWFGNGAIPSAVLKNTKKTINPAESREIKARYRATVAAGDVFVTGNDWEYDLVQAQVAASNWLESKGASLVDVARFFGCPADMIDAAVSGQSITYANMGQRNTQLLITKIGPASGRREDALSGLLPAPRYVKLNVGSLLRMDPKSQAELLGLQIESRQKAPSEVRELLELAPYTDDQLAEFDRLFGRPQDKPTSTPSKSGGTP